jgi:hypothetical protein
MVACYKRPGERGNKCRRGEEAPVVLWPLLSALVRDEMEKKEGKNVSK